MPKGMTFGFIPFFGLGVAVSDLEVEEEDGTPRTLVWVAIHLPFMRVGIVF